LSSQPLLLDNFKLVKLEDKPLIDKHYIKYPPVHSDNLFTTMVSWKDYGNYHYTLFEDNLIIMTKVDNNIQFRPPIGKYDKDIVQQVLQLAKKEGSDPPIVIIDTQTKDFISKNFPELEFKPDRDYFDYVYLASDLAELPGTPYSKIRNRLNKFKKNFLYTVEIISDENMDEVREFLKRWCLWKDCESDPILENEKKAILYSVSHFFELGLSGINLRINGVIEAIAVYEKMSDDTALVHYEKGSPDYDGIYKAVNQETAKILQKKFKFINRESDMDLPGLRKVKMSYRPHHMVEVYHLDKQSLLF
jgi:hypothetical protein